MPHQGGFIQQNIASYQPHMVVAVPPPVQNVGGKNQYFVPPPFQPQQQQQIKSETHISAKKQSHAVSIIDPLTRKPINDVKSETTEKEDAKIQSVPKLNTNCSEFYPERQRKVSFDAKPPYTIGLTNERANTESE